MANEGSVNLSASIAYAKRFFREELVFLQARL